MFTPHVVYLVLGVSITFTRDGITSVYTPDRNIHGANVGHTWGRQDPDGPHVGHTNIAIWDIMVLSIS